MYSCGKCVHMSSPYTICVCDLYIYIYVYMVFMLFYIYMKNHKLFTFYSFPNCNGTMSNIVCHGYILYNHLMYIVHYMSCILWHWHLPTYIHMGGGGGSGYEENVYLYIRQNYTAKHFNILQKKKGIKQFVWCWCWLVHCIV